MDLRIKYSLLGVLGAVVLANLGCGFNADAFVSRPAEQEPAAAAAPAAASPAEASEKKEDRINIKTESPAVAPAPATPSQESTPSAAGEKQGEKDTPAGVVIPDRQPDEPDLGRSEIVRRRRIPHHGKLRPKVRRFQKPSKH